MFKSRFYLFVIPRAFSMTASAVVPCVAALLMSLFSPGVLAAEADSYTASCGNLLGPVFQNILLVPINTVDKVEVTFVWKAGTSREVKKEAWIKEMIQGTRSRYPFLSIPLSLKVILTEEKGGLARSEWGSRVIETYDSPNLEVFQAIALHEWAHHLIAIRLHRSPTFSGKEKKRVSEGIEEFLADLFGVLWLEDLELLAIATREVSHDRQGKGPYSTAFFTAWNGLRSFATRWDPARFEKRLRGLCRAANKRPPSTKEFKEVHGYFGWLRGEVGAHWDEVQRDKAAYFERALAAAAYWDASFRPTDDKNGLLTEIQKANRIFAAILGLNP